MTLDTESIATIRTCPATLAIVANQTKVRTLIATVDFISLKAKEEDHARAFETHAYVLTNHITTGWMWNNPGG